MCKKIFLTKQKEFKIEEQRLVSKEQKLLAKRGERKMEVHKNLRGASKKKDWKKESEKLRKVIAEKKGKKIEEINNDPTCPHCEKRFPEKQMGRH